MDSERDVFSEQRFQVNMQVGLGYRPDVYTW